MPACTGIFEITFIQVYLCVLTLCTTEAIKKYMHVCKINEISMTSHASYATLWLFILYLPLILPMILAVVMRRFSNT